MPYMSMTAKTVVGKFEAATPCGGKIGNVVKIQKMVSSPEKTLPKSRKVKNMKDIGEMWKIPPH